MDGISIVIISRGREDLLEELLESVQTAQKRVEFPTEVVLVDSSLGSSRPRVEAVAEKFRARYFYQDITVSAKRNFGAQQCRYEIILFLDSDCRVTADILKHYAAVYQAHPEARGAAGPLEFVGKDTWFWSVIEKTPYTLFFSMPRWGDTLLWAVTANFSVKRDAFLSVGGFDETFPKNPGGEDVDLGLRLTEAGYTLFSAPEALVWHSKATWSPIKAMFRRVFHYGTGDAYLVERYPRRVCASMPRRIPMMLCGILLYILLGLLVNPGFFLAAVLIPFVEVVAVGLSVNLFEKYKATTFVRQLAVQALVLWNEAGYLWGCLRRGKFRDMGRQFILFPGQMTGICHQNLIGACLYVIFAMVTLILTLFLKIGV